MSFFFKKTPITQNDLIPGPDGHQGIETIASSLSEKLDYAWGVYCSSATKYKAAHKCGAIQFLMKSFHIPATST